MRRLGQIGALRGLVVGPLWKGTDWSKIGRKRDNLRELASGA